VNKVHNLTRNELKKLHIIYTQESHFEFNGKFYDQIDGVAMGSPWSRLFANVFMSHFERKHMERMKELGLKTWMRLLDETHATVGEKGQAIVICMFLNEQHPQRRRFWRCFWYCVCNTRLKKCPLRNLHNN
jgi:hypothetical protein